MKCSLMGQMPPQKHIIEFDNTTIASTAQTSFLLAKGVINPDPFTDATQCRVGSILGDMTVQLDFTIDTASHVGVIQQVDWYIGYNINDAQTMPTANNIMGSAGADLLSQVFHQDGCMMQSAVSTGTAPYNVSQWRVQVSIPKSWRKIMRGDTVRLFVKMGNAANTFVKLRVIYKEYYP